MRMGKDLVCIYSHSIGYGNIYEKIEKNKLIISYLWDAYYLNTFFSFYIFTLTQNCTISVNLLIG